jgi:hypothetical protein
MLVTCNTCRRVYDDAQSWTICPHGPIGFALTDYCPKCDTLRSVQGPCRHQLEEAANKFLNEQPWTLERIAAYVALLASLFGRLLLYLVTEPFRLMWKTLWRKQ